MILATQSVSTQQDFSLPNSLMGSKANSVVVSQEDEAQYNLDEVEIQVKLKKNCVFETEEGSELVEIENSAAMPQTCLPVQAGNSGKKGCQQGLSLQSLKNNPYESACNEVDPFSLQSWRINDTEPETA